MSFRDKSNLKDYLRNNSGSKLIDEIKKEFENNKKAWFDNKTNGFPFRRDGFPFKNDDIFGNKSDPGIKSHLEDLAKKHPEFAGDLQRPLWEEPLNSNWDHAFTIPVSVVGDNPDKPSSSQSKPAESEVDGQAGQANSNGTNQETMNESQETKEPKRFTSKIEITPVNPYEDSAPAAATEQGKQSQPGTPNTARKQPQVRHIPIFVEGRSEPVIPKSGGNFQSNFPQHEQQIPIKRKIDNETPVPKQEIPTQQIPVHVEKSKPKPAEKHEPEPVKVERPQIQKPDPLSRIHAVQKEVDELTAEVEKFNGTSRTQKEYLYLDEMLTRNLIKLDTIEVEGNETLRVARKDVIKSIQKAIALLESKVPLPASTEQVEQDVKDDASTSDKSMEVDQSSQNDPQNQNNDGGGQSK